MSKHTLHIPPTQDVVDEFSDVTLKIGDTEIQSCRTDLARASKVLRHMLSGGFSETDASVIDLSGFEQDDIVMIKVIHWICTRGITCETLHGVFSVISVAYMLDISELKQVIYKKMDPRFSKLEFFKFAVEMQDKDMVAVYSQHFTGDIRALDFLGIDDLCVFITTLKQCHEIHIVELIDQCVTKFLEENKASLEPMYTEQAISDIYHLVDIKCLSLYDLTQIICEGKYPWLKSMATKEFVQKTKWLRTMKFGFNDAWDYSQTRAQRQPVRHGYVQKRRGYVQKRQRVHW
jgi:hypothetical protein